VAGALRLVPDTAWRLAFLTTCSAAGSTEADRPARASAMPLPTSHRAAATRIVVAIGTTSTDTFPQRTATALAERLGTSPADFHEDTQAS
jgi:hypothetical protein